MDLIHSPEHEELAKALQNLKQECGMLIIFNQREKENGIQELESSMVCKIPDGQKDLVAELLKDIAEAVEKENASE